MSKLQLIFEKQQELMNKYQEIEEGPSLYGPYMYVVDLDNREYQAKLRRVAWWITEELCEAMEELRISEYDLQLEEIIDALHFAVELCILSGITSNDILDGHHEHTYIMRANTLLRRSFNNWKNINCKQQHKLLYSRVIRDLGMTINFLKNKPWKQSFRPTIKDRYISELKRFFMSLISLFVLNKWDMDDIYNSYMKKHNINKERQEGGY